ncbi:hypothetical protein DFJ58DRAFT_650166, partial [Suillus subalutaceus]|uniref:uncharacterized protein n=1 Tax=Suillus subalutaceus TaxID=48586 RepID=UPI001B8676E5
GKLKKMFDCLFTDSHGCTQMMEWFRPRVISSVSTIVNQEMDVVKEILQGTLDSITLEFLLMWDLNSTIQNAVVSKVPVLNSILHRAAQTDCTKDKNKLKDCSTV